MYVTPESFTAGDANELARCQLGPRRALIFARLSNGGFAVVTCATGYRGEIERVCGAVECRPYELDDLARAIDDARAAYARGAS